MGKTGGNQMAMILQMLKWKELWKDMKTNASWIAQFHSLDDPLVPISQARHVHKELNTEYTELTSSGHFQDDEFPELLQFIKAKLLDK